MLVWMDRLGMDSAFADRYLNEGFSGGEKKRNEILQMALLEPEMAILDETDSGLDIDALKTLPTAFKKSARTAQTSACWPSPTISASSITSSPTTYTS